MQKNWRSNYLFIAAVLGVFLLFIFLRLYRISESLLFFNDIGRDFLVLLNWLETGKPPLLGPQTSAIPYNQSAWYFYLLYPLFIITNHSLFSTIYTNILWYVFGFAALFWWLRDSKISVAALLTVFFLITIAPQVIIQHRFIWNPSFVLLPLLAAELALLQLQQRYSKLSVVIFGVSAAFAVALTYSVIPAVLVMLVVSIWTLKKQSIQLLFASGIAAAFFNLPTLVFELRHGFILTKMLLQPERSNVVAKSLNEQIPTALSHLLVVGQPERLIIATAFLLVCGALLAFALNKKFVEQISVETKITSFIALCTFIFTVAAPIAMHAHYIFGILVTAFVAIAYFPQKIKWLFVVALTVFWMQPGQLNAYFARAYRTPEETQNCVLEQCTRMDQPFYVSVQSGLHPYHDGMEFKYLFRDAGCHVPEISISSDQAQQMVVVVDSSGFELGKTTYNELTQFGTAKEIRRDRCGSLLEFVVLEKSKPILEPVLDNHK